MCSSGLAFSFFSGSNLAAAPKLAPPRRGLVDRAPTSGTVSFFFSSRSACCFLRLGDFFGLASLAALRAGESALWVTPAHVDLG